MILARTLSHSRSSTPCSLSAVMWRATRIFSSIFVSPPWPNGDASATASSGASAASCAPRVCGRGHAGVAAREREAVEGEAAVHRVPRLDAVDGVAERLQGVNCRHGCFYFGLLCCFCFGLLHQAERYSRIFDW